MIASDDLVDDLVEEEQLLLSIPVKESWKRVTLSDVCHKLKSGSTPSTDKREYWDGDIPLVKVEDVVVNDKYLIDTQSHTNATAINAINSWLVPSNSILLSMYGTPGEVVINSVPVAVTQNVLGIIPNTDIIDLDFFYFALKYSKYNIGRLSDKTIFKYFSLGKAKQIVIPLPPLPEQRAIARVLRAAQDAIQARRRELALERERKAALMQHLFTHGTRGEATKQTEIGEMPVGWDIQTIKSIATISSGGTPSKDRSEWWQGTIPWASSKDIKIDFLADTEDHITPEALSEGSNLAPANSLLMVVRGMSLAKTIPVSLIETPMAFNQDLKNIVIANHISPTFVLYAIQHYKDKLSRFVGTSAHGTKKLDLSSVEDFLIPIPNIDEQIQIVEILKLLNSYSFELECETQLLEELFRALLEELMTGRLAATALVAAQGGGAGG